MKRSAIISILLLLLLLTAASSFGQDLSQFEKVEKLIDSARVVEAPVFAPDAFQKAERKFAQAKEAVDRGKDQKSINSYSSEALEYIENSIKATEVAKLTLKEYLPPRDKARAARAPSLTPETYDKAEEQFMKATAKVESGNVKGGLQEAEKSVALFDTAELEAIRSDILGQAVRLIAKAETDEADKYALSTLNKARTTLTKADAIIVNDRYNRDAAIAEAKMAEYHARHASNIAQMVRSLNRNDQAWEKLMLVYEIEMDRVGQALGMDYLPFDNGPQDAANKIIGEIKARTDQLAEEKEVRAEVMDNITQTLDRLGSKQIEDDPVKLTKHLDSLIANLLEENRDLADKIMAEKTKLEELEKSHEEVSAELSQRQEREDKFRKAKQLLNPSEGTILYNASNDIVLRLSGLSFDVNKFDIKDEHIPLLQKVIEIIKMFPDATLLVEGHTDDQGDPAANVQLSEKRAYEVMKYLRQVLLISADDISSIGYGADKPIASNKTADGRAKNRRIDIIIQQ